MICNLPPQYSSLKNVSTKMHCALLFMFTTKSEPACILKVDTSYNFPANFFSKQFKMSNPDSNLALSVETSYIGEVVSYTVTV